MKNDFKSIFSDDQSLGKLVELCAFTKLDADLRVNSFSFSLDVLLSDGFDGGESSLR